MIRAKRHSGRLKKDRRSRGSMVKNGFPRPAVLLLCMLVLLCGLSFPCPAAAAEKDLTLMIYMAGSDLETQNGAASADIREMLDAGCDFGRMNVVILAGGAERWHLGLNPEELSVLQLGVRGMRVVQRLPQASMGQPDTLTVAPFGNLSCHTDTPLINLTHA